jgi:propionyl-CoA carboxylase alpha chain
MNTRLQVEHPVTELITGVDLVEQMIRVAAGEALPFQQSDLKLHGWAVETRVYAEDPLRNFLPSIGRLVRYRPPDEGMQDGVTIRNDTGVYEGGEISLFYDPMIAKLITHAATRAQAVSAMSGALDAFYIDGIRHNIPFLAAIMQHPRWLAGELSTAFIAEEFPDGFCPRAPDVVLRDKLACVATAIDHLGNERRRKITGQMDGDTVYFADARVALISGEAVHLRVTGKPGETVHVDLLGDNGEPRAHAEVVSTWRPGEPVWRGTIAGKPLAIQVRPILNGVELTHAGVVAEARVYTKREAELAALMPKKQAADTSKVLCCPMPGLVRAINVAEKQAVKAGDPLCTVEAMKMENILRAERDATVKAVKVKPGDSLAVDAVIMEFE